MTSCLQNIVKDYQAWRQFYRTVTVIVKALLPVPPALLAPTVTADVAAAVGVPEINPVAVLIVSPAGSPVALYDVAPPVAVI
jgi:hypothetical protein